jgi:hypothetical protein
MELSLLDHGMVVSMYIFIKLIMDINNGFLVEFIVEE